VVLPPGHGRSVTDFWGWDAHEAQLRCPDDVSGDIGGCSARRALKTKFYQPTQTMVTAGILPFREYSHGRAGNRTRDLMISSQRLTTRPRGWSGKIFLEVLFNVLIPMGGCLPVCFFVYVSFVFAEGFCDEFNFRWHRSSKTPFFARSSD